MENYLEDLYSLQGKTAMVVGYKGNLGPIWARALEGAGAKVFSIGMPDTDVRQIHQLERARYIQPDIIVYNAAIDNPPASDGDGTDPYRNYEDINNVNHIGFVNVCRAFVPGMISRGGGVLIPIGSIMGFGAADSSNYDNGWIKPFAYNASKAAIRQFIKSETEFHGHHNIRCVVPSFGPVDLGQLPDAFKERFLPKVPLRRAVSPLALEQTLIYAAACPELAGDLLVDAGYRMKTG
jgi:NAD(P)-dependent dehydrogenase (short-subunit alcohol dehydrogenase family)